MSDGKPDLAHDAEADKVGRVVFGLCKAYWFALSVFVVAGILAFLGHHLDEAFRRRSLETEPHRYQHLGWAVGAFIGLVGIPFGWSRVSIGTPVKTQSPQPNYPIAGLEPPISAAYMVRAALIGTLIGAILGIAVGLTWFVIWLSIALSPMSPTEWSDSIQFDASSLSTSHPTAGGVFLGAIIMCSLLGLLLGVIGPPLSRRGAKRRTGQRNNNQRHRARLKP